MVFMGKFTAKNLSFLLAGCLHFQSIVAHSPSSASSVEVNEDGVHSEVSGAPSVPADGYGGMELGGNFFHQENQIFADEDLDPMGLPRIRRQVLASTTIKTSVNTPTSTSTFATKSTTSSLTSPTTAPATFNAADAHVAAAATTTSTCFSTFSNARIITGTGSLPKPTTFVKRASGSTTLTLDGANYRIVGTNMYWLCNDENVPPVGYYTDKGRVREALAMAVSLGANTIRVLSCGVSVGFEWAVSPTLNTFQDQAWDIRDYVIFAAQEYGLRVIMTLTDNYDYYHGGKYTWLRWRNLSTANNGALFYTNAQVIADFQNYVAVYMTHRNVYTGRTYANEPAILAWETGNEMGGYIGAEGYPPASWTQAIVNAIKYYDQNHLIIDGTDGIYNYTTKATAPGLGVTGIDIMSDHGYPRNSALVKAEIPYATNAGKALFLGEYDWTNSFGGDTLATYITTIEAAGNGFGDMIWNLMGHDAQCCNFVQHNDGYSMYYPNGNTAALQSNILAVSQHWFKVTGRAVPRIGGSVLCPQPVF